MARSTSPTHQQLHLLVCSPGDVKQWKLHVVNHVVVMRALVVVELDACRETLQVDAVNKPFANKPHSSGAERIRVSHLETEFQTWALGTSDVDLIGNGLLAES